MRKDYDEPIRWDRWGFRNPAACFETLPSSRGGVSKHATETTATIATLPLFYQPTSDMASAQRFDEALADTQSGADEVRDFARR